MKKDASVVLPIVDIVMGLVWCAIMLLFSPFIHAFSWGAFVLGVVAFFVAGITMLVLSPGHESAVEVDAIAYYYTGGYLVIAVLVNTLYIFLAENRFLPVLIAFDIIAIMVYLIMVMMARQYNARLSNQMNKVTQKSGNVHEISTQLGILLSIASDDNIKKQIYGLKEKIDFSDNLSQYYTDSQEREFLKRISTLMQMITEGTETGEISAEIRQLELLWANRNSRK